VRELELLFVVVWKKSWTKKQTTAWVSLVCLPKGYERRRSPWSAHTWRLLGVGARLESLCVKGPSRYCKVGTPQYA
jgi:hypothetical protein